MIRLFYKIVDPDDFTEEQLSAAAIAVRSSMLESLDKEEKVHHTFSELFLHRMQTLFRLDARRERKKHALQRVAVIIVGLFLAGSLFLAFNPEARAELANWIRSTYENSVFYEFFSNKSNKSGNMSHTLPDIEFTWLPGKYEIQEAYRDDNRIIILLLKGEDSITVDYWRSSYSEYFEVFTNDYVKDTAYVKGNPADYYQGRDSTANILVWLDENVVFCINSDLPKDTLIKIAEGIVKK